MRNLTFRFNPPSAGWAVSFHGSGRDLSGPGYVDRWGPVPRGIGHRFTPALPNRQLELSGSASRWRYLPGYHGREAGTTRGYTNDVCSAGDSLGVPVHDHFVGSLSGDSRATHNTASPEARLVTGSRRRRSASPPPPPRSSDADASCAVLYARPRPQLDAAEPALKKASPSTPAQNPFGILGRDDFPATTKRQINYRARTLARHFRLNEHDREDLVQDLSLAIIRAMKKYDPTRASPTHFARVVADFWYACNARRLGRECLRRAAMLPLAPWLEDQIAEGKRDDFARADAAMDATDSVLDLPAYQRLAALMLERLSVAEIAVVLGVHPLTIRRWFRGGGKRNHINPCNTSSFPAEE